jgi:hypothetical protein
LTPDFLIQLPPSDACAFRFEAHNGKTACLRFTNEGVTYTGDLPLDDAARQLFVLVQGRVCAQREVSWSGMSFGVGSAMYQLGARADGVVAWRKAPNILQTGPPKAE